MNIHELYEQKTNKQTNSFKTMDNEAAFFDVIKIGAWKVRRLF